ncbi:hypothetical protein [Thioclava atlantica]|uniref:Uncharacterized protein n=1 Tax=Thioclava atlantica TaxID=1317124 RepID=A0A085TYY2_9RHOB|nr:hypothetical protein [Thioclava atlantica]KFE35929.1 hypothetical protein DW2_04850 [Thioclava atlantica]
MQNKLIALSLGFALLIPFSHRAQAQGMTCGTRSDLIGQLHERYRETRRAVALAANNSVLEIFAADSGSWSILVTKPGGATCLFASGEAYESLSETLPVQGSAL